MGMLWGVLGASCWLIFRSLSLPWPLLTSFLVSLSLPEAVFIDFLDFLSPRTLPEPRKSMKNHWFSQGFRYFYILAKKQENPSKMLPKWSLEASKASQEPAKSLPRHSKMTSKRLQDALRRSQTHPKHAPDTPKMCQDCPRRHKTSQRRPQGLSKARFLMVWEA